MKYYARQVGEFQEFTKIIKNIVRDKNIVYYYTIKKGEFLGEIY